MKITVDTNLLLRVILLDDLDQAHQAEEALRSASLVAIPLPCLCEVVWVLDRSYGISRAEIALVLETLLSAPNVAINKAAVNAGMSVLKAGGDFADGVIAHEGRWLGGETFVSFDKKAVARLGEQGHKARLLA
jgi:predicted nucleic-acid-binding protein